MLRSTLTLICALLAGVGAFAQFPQSDPSPQMAAMAKMAGTWTGTLRMFQPGVTETMEAKCTMVYTPRLGGAFMETSVTYEMPGMGSMSGIELITYDAEAGLYRSWWYDASSPTPVVFSGKMEDKTLAMTSEPKALLGMEGPQVMRTVTKHVSNTEIEFRLMIETGGDWTPIFEGTFKKQ